MKIAALVIQSSEFSAGLHAQFRVCQGRERSLQPGRCPGKPRSFFADAQQGLSFRQRRLNRKRAVEISRGALTIASKKSDHSEIRLRLDVLWVYFENGLILGDRGTRGVGGEGASRSLEMSLYAGILGGLRLRPGDLTKEADLTTEAEEQAEENSGRPFADIAT